jgi:hypothetical protein
MNLLYLFLVAVLRTTGFFDKILPRIIRRTRITIIITRIMIEAKFGVEI